MGAAATGHGAENMMLVFTRPHASDHHSPSPLAGGSSGGDVGGEEGGGASGAVPTPMIVASRLAPASFVARSSGLGPGVS